jgi:hypothetical protein
MSQDQPTRLRKPRRRLAFLSRAEHLAIAIFFAAVMALLIAPAPPSVPSGSGGTGGTVALQSAGALQITMSPTLSPAFDPNISDYVFTFKTGVSEQISVNAPRNTKVSVDGQAFRKLAFTTKVNLTPGQSFSFVVNSLAGSKTYFVRCLPTDFPTWTTERPGIPQPEFYIFGPNLSTTGAPPRNYAIIADGYGVPLWWYHGTGVPTDTKLLPNGNIAWTDFPGGAEERRLDGSLVRTFTSASEIGGVVDDHELLLLPNGDYLLIANLGRSPVDLSPFGGSKTATIIDNVIEEIAPNGTLVWHWSAAEHIPVSETDPHWWPQFLANSSPADPYHMNSLQPDGNGLVVSLRHLNAIIRIDKASGNIVWKLSGTPRPVSLTFEGDPFGNFAGQYDARLLPDGTLTVHDNGTLLGRAPRAVRYSIDPIAKTATFVEQVNDPDVPSSGCCGSARKVPGGDWVMSWGQNPVVTELTPGGNRIFRMKFLEPYFAYRAAPVPVGVLSRAALRSGMDAQFPR